MMQPHSTPKKGTPTVIIFLCITALLMMSAGQVLGLSGSALPASAQSNQPTPVAPVDLISPIFFPLINQSNFPAEIDLNSVWVGNAAGSKTAFLPGDPIHYVASGTNYSTYAGIIRLTWTLTSACDTTVIYSQNLTIQPGAWQETFISSVPTCLGISIVTADITGGTPQSRSTLFVAFPPSAVVLDNRQAFDRCVLPTVGQMQTWWNSSPYDVFNIYLGGGAFACPTNPLDAYWLDAVYRQGWRFILTWVGPQAPCTSYHLRMSSNSTIAFQQGRDEAGQAAAAADRLGILAGKIIYYDVESYSGATTECRNAVDAFMRGWTQRLHELGAKAGGYGSPLNSYLADWANNNPPPDDVWIAHWYTPYYYDPNATVWTQYLSNSLWSNHQRLRQYAGGHNETWGGVSLVIDSSVLDGEITALLAAQPAADVTLASGIEIASPPQIHAMDLVRGDSGWVLKGNRLLWSDDGGQTWVDITPQGDALADILSVAFLDTHQGWIVRRTLDPDASNELQILLTQDGGTTWQVLTSFAGAGAHDPSVASVTLDIVDANTAWLAVKLQSGSSFSLGNLYFTQDAGHTWQARTLPIGEPVKFLDANQGWVVGGPSGEQIFTTRDGGLTWQEVSLPVSKNDATSRAVVGLPQFSSSQVGYLPVTRIGESQSEFILYETGNGGESWRETTRLFLNSQEQAGSPLAFSLEPGGRWWAGTPATGSLYTAANSTQITSTLTASGLPQGMIGLDFNAKASGWALVQEGLCQGNKLRDGELPGQRMEPFVCALHTRLLATSDGGRSWNEISPHLP